MVDNLVISHPEDTSLLPKQFAVATLAGGCFWCTQAAYRNLKGVVSVVSGYAGGKKNNPSYDEVYDASLQFRESIQVVFDSSKTSFEDILAVYWQNIDPCDAEGQFFDRGYVIRRLFFTILKNKKGLQK